MMNVYTWRHNAVAARRCRQKANPQQRQAGAFCCQQTFGVTLIANVTSNWPRWSRTVQDRAIPGTGTRSAAPLMLAGISAATMLSFVLPQILRVLVA